MTLEERVAQLEKQVAELQRCNHELEKAENGNLLIFNNGTNYYHRCKKCEKRFRT